MKRKWFLIAGLTVFLLAAGWFFYLYQKPREDVATVNAAYSLTAEKLFDDFVANETAADQKYTGKIIQVRGVPSDVQLMDSTAMVLLAAGNDTGGINCNLRNSDVALPEKGQSIIIKGRCTGFLMDVNLVDAVIVE